jgi:hypothetical protein
MKLKAFILIFFMAANAQAADFNKVAGSRISNYQGSSLVDTARHYMGKTGPAIGLPGSQWCSDFMNFITGGGTGSRLAESWLANAHISKQIGAVVVLGYRGYVTHVGLVSGISQNGDPIVISGNHNNRVGEGIYPQSMVIAYVVAFP